MPQPQPIPVPTDRISAWKRSKFSSLRLDSKNDICARTMFSRLSVGRSRPSFILDVMVDACEGHLRARRLPC